MDRFLSAAGGRDRAILEVAAASGMRAGEIRAFDCSWIRWHEDRIEVECAAAFAPKSRRPRSLPMGRKLRAVLEGWLGRRREGQVFPPMKSAGKHGPNKGPDLRKVVARVRAASGVPIRDLHDLRHHYLSWCTWKGMDPQTVQELAGHRDGRTTQHYTHAARDYLARAREIMDREDPVTADVTAAGSATGPTLVRNDRDRGRPGTPNRTPVTSEMTAGASRRKSG